MVTLVSKNLPSLKERHPFDDNYAFIGQTSEQNENVFFFIIGNTQIGYLDTDGIMTLYDAEEYVTIEGWCENMKIKVNRIFHSCEDYSITITY